MEKFTLTTFAGNSVLAFISFIFVFTFFHIPVIHEVCVQSIHKTNARHR